MRRADTVLGIIGRQINELRKGGSSNGGGVRGLAVGQVSEHTTLATCQLHNFAASGIC